MKQPWKPTVIKNRKEYQKALAVADRLIVKDLKKSSPEAVYLETVVILVDEYEKRTFKKLEAPSAAAALAFRMEQGGHTQHEVSRITGIHQATISLIVRGKVWPTVKQANILHKRLGIPLLSLVTMPSKALK